MDRAPEIPSAQRRTTEAPPLEAELTDEQLDQVAGGRAVIFETELTQSEVINH
jgi:hypothetical protein